MTLPGSFMDLGSISGGKGNGPRLFCGHVPKVRARVRIWMSFWITGRLRSAGALLKPLRAHAAVPHTPFPDAGSG